MTKKEMKKKAQDIIMDNISTIGYRLEDEELGRDENFRIVLKQQMDRVAKIMGYEESWFS